MQDAEEFCIEEEVDDEEKKSRPIIKNAMDLQRLKLEKLMKNPEKPIIIPEPQKEKDFMQSVPTFVRNVMGSSAGAGSGEFHVYRHLRRKEYARQKFIQAKSIREQLDDEYRQKLEQNRLDAEAKTAKRRAKRLKKKEKMKNKGKRPKKEHAGNQKNDEHLSESSESEGQSEVDEKIQNVEKQMQTVERSEASNESKIFDSISKRTDDESVDVGDSEKEDNLVNSCNKTIEPLADKDTQSLIDKENPDNDKTQLSSNDEDGKNSLREKGKNEGNTNSNT